MPQRILVIEDNHDIAHLVELHLSDAGFDVELAELRLGVSRDDG